VETIEALGTFDQPHRLQQALADEGAVQCGFCTPGMILSAKALLDEPIHTRRGTAQGTPGRESMPVHGV
jgi:carbon-monoxide dehydrogenase small subunit